jgi:hypothetical protein
VTRPDGQLTGVVLVGLAVLPIAAHWLPAGSWLARALDSLSGVEDGKPPVDEDLREGQGR